LQKTKPADKIAFKITHLDSRLQKLVLELGLGSEVIKALGPEWKSLCDACILAETALAKIGGSSVALNSRRVHVPECLVEWSNARRNKSSAGLDFTGISSDMAGWWLRLGLRDTELAPNDLIKEDWCIGGLAGIVLFLIGLKKWGMSLGNEDKTAWAAMVENVEEVFRVLPEADDL
jgi:hypothetical protein